MEQDSYWDGLLKYKKIMYSVDIPPPNPQFESWTSIELFVSRKEAVDFAMKYYGADSEGKISLVRPLSPEEED